MKTRRQNAQQKTAPRSSMLPSLPNETLLSILNYLSADGDLTFSFRLVSKHFDALVTPLIYSDFSFSFGTPKETTSRIQKVMLTPSRSKIEDHLMSRSSTGISTLGKKAQTALKVLENIRDYTRILGVYNAVIGFGTLLSNLPFLRLQTVKFLDSHSIESFESTLLPAFAASRVIDIEIPDLDIETCRSLSSLPADKAVRIRLKKATLEGFMDYDNEIVERLRFISEHAELESLHLNPSGTPGAGLLDMYRLPIVSGLRAVRMPAIKTLVLDGYAWTHSRLEFARMWDWSHLTQLTVRKSRLVGFLRSIRIEDFVNLQILQVDSEWNTEVHEHEDTERLLCQLISTARSLRVCAIHHVSTEDMDSRLEALQKHAETLTEFALEKWHQTILFGIDMQMVDLLCNTFHKITDVTTNVELETVYGKPIGWNSTTIGDWCQALGRHRNLRRLTLYAWVTRYRTMAEYKKKRLSGKAREIKATLVTHKQGVPFEQITFVGVQPA